MSGTGQQGTGRRGFLRRALAALGGAAVAPAVAPIAVACGPAAIEASKGGSVDFWWEEGLDALRIPEVESRTWAFAGESCPRIEGMAEGCHWIDTGQDPPRHMILRAGRWIADAELAAGCPAEDPHDPWPQSEVDAATVGHYFHLDAPDPVPEPARPGEPKVAIAATGVRANRRSPSGAEGAGA